MNRPALYLCSLALCAHPLFAGLLDDVEAGNVGATNATISFHSTDAAGRDMPTAALLEWGGDSTYGNRTEEQFASGATPGLPVTGMRALYIDDLRPGTTYVWRVTAMAADGKTEQRDGKFTTLPVDPTRKRGPDGKHVPPHTPAYATPATYVAPTWNDVNGLLKTCRGGEVIEVAEEVSSAAGLILLTGGRGEWEQNVLIRPLLGKRSANRVDAIEINSPNITVAGFNLRSASMYPKYGNKHPGNSSGEGAHRTFYWMCTLERGGILLANGSPDSGWYEVVALRRSVGSDRSQIKTFAGVSPDNFTIAGCWLEGRDRTNDKDHSDTLQTLGLGKQIKGLEMIDSVFFRSANSCGQLTDLNETLIENCWFGPLIKRSKVCGSFYATLGACKGSIIRNSDWNGSFQQDAAPEEITNSRFEKLAQLGRISQGNTIGGGLAPQPPLPDLASIWPR